MTKQSENLIHIKIEENEVPELKKDVLATKMNLLKIIKNIKEFNSLRSKELKLKNNLKKQTKDFKNGITNIKRLLPELKKPKFLKEHEKTEDKSIEKPKTKEKSKQKEETKNQPKSIDQELQEIQNKLANL